VALLVQHDRGGGGGVVDITGGRRDCWYNRARIGGVKHCQAVL